MIHIDFETRGKVDLRKRGAWRYSEDPDTDILCLAFKIDEGPIDLWVPGEAVPDELARAIRSGMAVAAYGVHFERAIWENIAVPRYGFPLIKSDQWTCVASKVAAHALPRKLADVAKALNLPEQKDMTGSRVMMKLAKPNKKGGWHEKKADLKTLYDYCVQDVATECAVDKAVRDLSKDERAIWQLDQKINTRGIAIDTELVSAALRMIEEHTEVLSKELTKLTDGQVTSATERDNLLFWLDMHGYAMEDMTKGTVAEALKSAPAKFKRILEIRQETGKTSTAKYEAFKNAVCKDGRVRNLLLYHGASTGRWSGMLVQPQNFPRDKFKDPEPVIIDVKTMTYKRFKEFYPNVLETLSKLLRPCFIASPGHTLYGGDYNAIEARVLFWLAGDEKALNTFRKGEDIYADLARIIYSCSEINKEQRDLGKRGILGCGYGMGAKKFKATCDLWGSPISEELSERVVQAYRSRYYSVVRFWYDQESAAIEAVKTGRAVRCGKILWATHNGSLYCRLPSGRCLAYYDPKILNGETPWGEKKSQLSFMAVNSVTRKWERDRTYGGKIVENITQAVARDVMANAMLKCEVEGYKLLLSVHDELITERHDDDFAIDSLEDIMVDLPAWADGLPVKAETWSNRRYCK